MLSLQDTLDIITREIGNIRYPDKPAGLYAPIAYLLNMDGKKIRPAFTLLACNLYREDVRAAIRPALAWEIFHNFTLMHDDMIDKADMRRGKPAVHRKWDANTAILSGDAMLIMSYLFMAGAPEEKMKPLLELFSGTAAKICEGQYFDMTFERRSDVSEAEYIEMIRLKTAVMFGACLRSGAMIGGATEADGENLYDFGIYLGIAFQIRDDLLDVYGNPAVFGKKTGGDILCNKKTFLLITALNAADGRDRENLLNRLSRNDNPEEKIATVRNIYNKLGIPEKTEETIRSFYRKAQGFLDTVSINEYKKGALKTAAQELLKLIF
jgi:geranylgeranyl diphosphate synthase type II